jgi:hypothetical protein
MLSLEDHFPEDKKKENGDSNVLLWRMNSAE